MTHERPRGGGGGGGPQPSLATALKRNPQGDDESPDRHFDYDYSVRFRRTERKDLIMADPRVAGLMLMGVSIAAFMGTTRGDLPPLTFFPALMLFGLGAIKFLRTNRKAMGAAEEKARQRLNPVIRENRHAEAHAERQANRRGAGLQGINALMDDLRAPAATSLSDLGTIEFDETEETLELGSDVSYPVELQEGDALADQLRKLSSLLSQGVLSPKEYAVAKSKLLS